MDAAGELAQLVERDGELLLRVGDGGAERRPVVCRLREAEAERECEEALLRAVVQVALEAAPLVVGGFDDPRPRCAHLVDGGPQLRLEPLVLQRHSRRSTRRVHELRLVVERRIVDDRGDPPTAAIDPRDRAVSIGIRQLDREPFDVDVVGRLRKPVGDLERVVAERTRQALAQPAGLRRLTELDDQVGDAEPRQPAAEQPDEEAQRHAPEGRDLEVVQRDARIDGARLVRGRSRRDEREGHEPDAQHGQERAAERGSRTAESRRNQDKRGGGCSDGDPALVAVQAGRDAEAAVNQQQVARQRRDGQRHELQDGHVEPGGGDRHPLEQGMQPTLRVGQERLREGSLREHRGQRTRSEENGDVRRLEQGQQPEGAVRDQVEADPVLRPPPPRHVAGGEKRPRRRQRQCCDRRLVGGVVADGDRVRTPGRRNDGKHDRGPDHAAAKIRPRRSRLACQSKPHPPSLPGDRRRRKDAAPEVGPSLPPDTWPPDSRIQPWKRS